MKILVVASARSAASSGTETIGLTPTFGAESVEGNFESYLAAVGVMDAVTRSEGEYHAIVQAVFGELGREGLQELLDVPVVDITGAAGRVVPVVDSVAAAVKLAEALVGLGPTTSKIRTFAAPRRKRVIGWPLSPGTHT